MQCRHQIVDPSSGFRERRLQVIAKFHRLIRASKSGNDGTVIDRKAGLFGIDIPLPDCRKMRPVGIIRPPRRAESCCANAGAAIVIHNGFQCLLAIDQCVENGKSFFQCPGKRPGKDSL